MADCLDRLGEELSLRRHGLHLRAWSARGFQTGGLGEILSAALAQDTVRQGLSSDVFSCTHLKHVKDIQRPNLCRCLSG